MATLVVFHAHPDDEATTTGGTIARASDEGRATFPQIAGQVFVSPNTVKSQAQSVYRKLGVTSRRGAVEHARAAGLLDPDGPESDTSKR